MVCTFKECVLLTVPICNMFVGATNCMHVRPIDPITVGKPGKHESQFQKNPVAPNKVCWNEPGAKKSRDARCFSFTGVSVAPSCCWLQIRAQLINISSLINHTYYVCSVFAFAFFSPPCIWLSGIKLPHFAYLCVAKVQHPQCFLFSSLERRSLWCSPSLEQMLTHRSMWYIYSIHLIFAVPANKCCMCMHRHVTDFMTNIYIYI